MATTMTTINCSSLSPSPPKHNSISNSRWRLSRNSIPTLARIPLRSIQFSVSTRRLHYQNRHNKGVLVLGSSGSGKDDKEPQSIELYGQIERLITNTARQSQYAWGDAGKWEEIEGAWVLRPNKIIPSAVVHFVGGIFVGAAPQLTYRFFLERLSERGYLVIATPFASGFDHFRIADEVQIKFDRCIRGLQDNVRDLPIYGVGHSLGTVIHLLIGARYAVQRSGNVFMSFNNKEASVAIPLFSPVIVPMAQSFGPILSQLTSSPTIRRGAEIALKQLESMSPPLLKQVLPLMEQLPPLYMDLVKGREDFVPHPEETRRLIKSYYGVSRNLLVKFKDDAIDETPVLAQVLSFESAVSACLDMSVRTLPGDHVLPLQQILYLYAQTILRRNLMKGRKMNKLSHCPEQPFDKDIKKLIMHLLLVLMRCEVDWSSAKKPESSSITSRKEMVERIIHYG